ncbi:hypothetical protein [Bradyrhizobium sp. USDA 4486]
MIYAPDITADKQLLSHSRQLVREAMALLRSSDHLVSALRLRDGLEEDHDESSSRDDKRAGDDL